MCRNIRDAAQLRAGGDARGDRGRGAAVRAQDQRLDEAVEGERGRVRARGRRGHGRVEASARLARDDGAAEGPRGRGRQGQGSRRCTLRVVSARARRNPLAAPLGAGHRPARALRRAGEGSAQALADDPARDRGLDPRRPRRRRSGRDRRRRHDHGRRGHRLVRVLARRCDRAADPLPPLRPEAPADRPGA